VGYRRRIVLRSFGSLQNLGLTLGIFLVVCAGCAAMAFAGCAADSAHSGRKGPVAGVSGSAGQAGTLGGAGSSAAGTGSLGNPEGGVPDLPDAAPPSAADTGTILEDDCGEIVAIVRDFSPATHADFERALSFDWSSLFGEGQKGIVKPMLENGYPAYAAAAATASTAGPAQFYQWYVDTPGVNMRFEVRIALTEDTPGHFVFDSNAFFPIDGMGFGNESNPHNFHFTTEVRTKFTYKGGEVFKFRGDDDLWLFLDGALALDLGGLHGALEGTVMMDQVATQRGWVVGQTYAMDIFHAERHTSESNYRIETTIDCFVRVEPPPPPPPPE
jgi:fibro-slime domain-containing protein